MLGDRFGVACGRWVIEAADEAFTAAGFVVARNTPFAGGYITQTYGRPHQGVHALQIEIDRSLYMDEARIERRADSRRWSGRSAGSVATLAGARAAAAVGRGGIAIRKKRGRARGSAQV